MQLSVSQPACNGWEDLRLDAVRAPALYNVEGEAITFRQLEDQIERTRLHLARCGIGPHSTVATCLKNGPSAASAFLALARHCRVAPLNPNYRVAEIEFSLRDLGACALVAEPGHEAASAACGSAGVPLLPLQPAVSPGEFTLGVEAPSAAVRLEDPPPDDVALLLHTSGTTARPKLVPLTRRNLALSASAVAEVLALCPEDRCLSLMPLFHIHGLVAGLLAPLLAGSSVVCAPGFQATSFFGWLDRSQATWFTAVPTMHQAILARARHNQEILSRHRLRLMRSSSAPLWPAVWEEAERVFGVPMLNAYGMTEAAHQIASMRIGEDPGFRTTVGRPAGPEVAILGEDGKWKPTGETGEIVLRGPQITAGYLSPPGANETAFHEGWFRTGDEGFLSPSGAVTLTGRIKELICCGGEKISPYEVEEALLSHPDIGEAVAFALPHPMLGEAVAAAVVPQAGCSIEEREVLSHAGERLARFKLPKRVVVVDEIPRGATGKLQRIGLAARLGLTGR